MEIALGMAFLMLLAMATWIAANEPTEALVPVRQVNPDQMDDESAWDLLGWKSFG